MHVEKSVDIEASPERVWSLVSDPEGILEWYLPLEEFRYTSEQRGVGAPSHFVEKVGGRRMDLDCAITDWVENERIAFEMTSGTFMKAYQEWWSIEPLSSGCRFTFGERRVLPYGLLGRLISPIAQRGSAATIDQMLLELKRLAEA